MDVILLERVAKLGAMGEVVKVKDGYARNFLLRRGKALRATDANKAKFERERAVLVEHGAGGRPAAVHVACWGNPRVVLSPLRGRHALPRTAIGLPGAVAVAGEESGVAVFKNM